MPGRPARTPPSGLDGPGRPHRRSDATHRKDRHCWGRLPKRAKGPASVRIPRLRRVHCRAALLWSGCARPELAVLEGLAERVAIAGGLG